MLKKADKVVLKETRYIAGCTIILSILTQAVFAVLGRWDLKVLLGNILGTVAAILNFYIMGITVQAVTEAEGESGKSKMRLSQTLRTFMLFAVAAVGCLAPCFNIAAVLIALFFPGIAIAFRPIIINDK